MHAGTYRRVQALSKKWKISSFVLFRFSVYQCVILCPSVCATIAILNCVGVNRTLVSSSGVTDCCCRCCCCCQQATTNAADIFLFYSFWTPSIQLLVGGMFVLLLFFFLYWSRRTVFCFHIRVGEKNACYFKVKNNRKLDFFVFAVEYVFFFNSKKTFVHSTAAKQLGKEVTDSCFHSVRGRFATHSLCNFKSNFFCKLSVSTLFGFPKFPVYWLWVLF